MLKVCGDHHYPPFEFINDEGVFKGFNVDLLQAIAKELDVCIEFEPMSWNRALEAVQSGTYDALQGMASSEKRLSNFDFSKEYLVVSQCIFICNSNKDVTKFEDLKGMKVAIQRGDVAYDLVNYKLDAPKKSLHYVLFDDQAEAILQLIEGKVDAFIGNQLTGIHYAQKLGKENDIRIVGEPFSPVAYGIAVAKGRDDLLSLFNRGIRAIKGNGVYDEICSRWFGCISSEVGEQIIENVAAGVIGLNKLGTVISINTYAKKFFKLEISPLRRHYLDTPLKELIDPSLLQETLNKGQAYFDLENSFGYMENELIISYNLCPLHDLDTAIMGAVITFRDITEEKKLKQSLRTKDKMQSLGCLLANIAHEIRNPLTSIKAFIDVLPKQINSPEYRDELLRHVPAEINRLDKLIADLIEYSRPRRANRKWCNVKNILESIISLGLYKNRSKKIYICVPNHLEVWADEQQLKQIFLNLIINAIEATADDGEIMIESVEDKDIIITIKDNGSGITDSAIKNIFDPYFSTKKSGTGLGLFITYQLIKENSADIHVRSQEGQGTCFELRFPIRRR